MQCNTQILGVWYLSFDKCIQLCKSELSSSLVVLTHSLTQLGVILPPMEHLIVCIDIFGCPNWMELGWVVLTSGE